MAMNYDGTIINDSPTFTAEAGGVIAGPFVAVSFADGKLVAATDKTVPFGITVAETEETTSAGDDIVVQIAERSMWKAGATFAAGDLLAADANGLAAKATAGQFVLGVALEAAAAAGDSVKVQITKSGYASA